MSLKYVQPFEEKKVFGEPKNLKRFFPKRKFLEMVVHTLNSLTQ